jgi:hypothetical protein
MNPYKLVHHFNVQNHSSSPHPEEQGRDDEQDDAEEDDLVPD